MKTTHLKNSFESLLTAKGLDRNPSAWTDRLQKITGDDVQKALNSTAGTYTLEKLCALISPAARNYIEQMAQLAQQLTIQRFGRTIKLFEPLYVSNYCVNSCRYCGFHLKGDFVRRRLTLEEAVREADIIAQEGFRDLLLVSGEDRKFASVDYFVQLAKRLRDKFSSISIEIYQVEKDEYAMLFAAGIEGMTMFQETYDRDVFKYFHPAGPKSNYPRLHACDDSAQAGMRDIGLGVLLGLNDWRYETLALAEHAHYLMKKYWQSRISFSFPRLRPAFDVGSEQFRYLLSDTDLVQMILALRLCFADAGLVLSTRESPRFRDDLIGLGITKISAGSKTNPGGYAEKDSSVGQFDVNDTRPPKQVADVIRKKGYEPVWKDWDKAFTAY